MNKLMESALCKATGAESISDCTVIQTLWKGYGTIFRVTLKGTPHSRIIAKHICFPRSTGKHCGRHPDRSHSRKLKSYRIEAEWYENWSHRCDEKCRIPEYLGGVRQGDEVVLLMEDLDAAGFDRRCGDPSWREITTGLHWLAEFHATFMGAAPENLWKVGTYWHLDTRPDELASLDDTALRAAAGRIDRKLRQTVQTIVHGDAKTENFCFSPDGSSVAAVDFQYVGGGCGMKDVAYFAASCMHENECEHHEQELLDIYFSALGEAMLRRGSSLSPEAVADEWRPLFRVAWVDFHRFYKGWSGCRFRNSSFSERIAQEVATGLR